MKRITFISVMLGCVLFFACQSAAGPDAPAAKESQVKSMSITGEIAQGRNDYIIRGQKPQEIFTILNPDPTVLDEFVKTGKTVEIKVRVVSGDNVEIQSIDGKKYHKKFK